MARYLYLSCFSIPTCSWRSVCKKRTWNHIIPVFGTLLTPVITDCFLPSGEHSACGGGSLARFWRLLLACKPLLVYSLLAYTAWSSFRQEFWGIPPGCVVCPLKFNSLGFYIDIGDVNGSKSQRSVCIMYYYYTASPRDVDQMLL